MSQISKQIEKKNPLYENSKVIHLLKNIFVNINNNK